MIGLRRTAIALGALAIAGSAILTGAPAEAQYGGYDRPGPSRDDGYDRRRGPRDDDDGPRRRGGDDGDRGGRGGGGAPQARGGFVQSCRDIRQDGFYLSASCRARGGGYDRSRIDVRSCRSIGNNNGRLVCE